MFGAAVFLRAFLFEPAMTDDADSQELFLREGEAWIPDGNALCKQIGASYIYFSDGDLWAGVAGSGDALVRDLLAQGDTPRKTATLTTIK